MSLDCGCKWDGALDGRRIRCKQHPKSAKPLTPEQIAHAAFKSEAMMWLMAGSNHSEVQLARLREYWNLYREAGGKSWGGK